MGGGFWARILRRGGLGSRSWEFSYTDKQNKKKTSEGGGGLTPLTPPPLDPLLQYTR